jgi:Uma2 family endonuclease
LGKRLDPDIIIGIQDPIQLDNYSEPQPDVSVLKPQEDLYASTHPKPSDVLVVIEVCDSTIAFDREVKLPTYARSGIAEVWLVDLNKERIEIHSNPLNGIYQEVRLVQRGQQVVSKTLPQLSLNADEVLD